jgi:hypothetical protein
MVPIPAPASEGFDRTAGQLRGVLRLARSLATMEDEQTLIHMVVNTARSALGYSACVLALKGDDGNFHHRASAGVHVENDRAFRNIVVTASAFEALTHASIALGGVHWVPPGHAVRDRRPLGRDGDRRLGAVSDLAAGLAAVRSPHRLGRERHRLHQPRRSSLWRVAGP